jgi:hypothetical protein
MPTAESRPSAPTEVGQMTWEEAVLWLRAPPDQVDLVRACYFDDPLGEAAERYRANAGWHRFRRDLGARLS